MNSIFAKALVTLFVAVSAAACVTPTGGPTDPANDALYSTDSFRSERVSELVAALAGERVLFVFDIDNTVLENPPGQFLGSAQWYSWQSGLPDGDPRKIECLLDAQGAAFYMGHMMPTEGGYAAAFVSTLQDAGHDVIALTARGPEYRYPTERELARAGVDFSNAMPRDHAGFPGRYRPAASSAIPRPRNASYQDGIAMLAGQHKGAALVDLLRRLGADGDYDVIVVFDDDEKNTKAFMDSFTKDRRRGIVFHYTAVDTAFGERDIDRAARGQEEIKEAYAQFARAPGCDI